MALQMRSSIAWDVATPARVRIVPVAARRIRVNKPSWITAFTKVPTPEAAALLQSGLTYVDVRTPEEYSAGHAVGAVNIPFMLKGEDGKLLPNPAFLGSVKERFPDTAEALIVGCRSGNRSTKACIMLEEELKYINLTEDSGGWLAWVEEKLPVEQ